MQLLAMPNSQQRDTARRRLTKAFGLETYFRGLLCENRLDEVYGQWDAARRLVTVAMADYVAANRRPQMARYTTSG